MSDKPNLYIALSLGHNASAIGIADGKIVAAYEQERFSREKSSSKFAVDAIDKIIELYQPDPTAENCFLISHWYDDFDFTDEFHSKINKHYNYDLIDEYKEKYNFKIIKLDEEFTHHDAHAVSAASFFMNHCTEQQYERMVDDNTYIFVMDGFGNKEEVVSIYTFGMDGQQNLKIFPIDRLYGYENSLGLMYQYATSFVGMKENEDEYKFLGYESRIEKSVDKTAIRCIKRRAKDFVEGWFKRFISFANLSEIHEIHEPSGKYINTEYLDEVRNTWYKRFEELLIDLEFNCACTNSQHVEIKRNIIGHYIQTIIELIHIKLLDYYKVDNVIVSGGLYYNVKLNNTILKHVPGFVCAAPLAGDQGAAIGLYVKNVDQFPYYDLTWGYRKLDKNVDIPENLKPYVEFIDTQEELVEKAFGYLKNNDIVQVVTGNMEFGPRALCNSSTLSIGYNDNVELINSINGRNTVMPFAPVTIPKAAEYLFDNNQLNRVVGSLGYMIVTVDYKPEVMDDPEAFKIYRGVANPYPGNKAYSGRPQVVQDENSYIYKLIDRLYTELGIGAIINTSLNVHGKPIVYTTKDAIDDLKFNLERAGYLRVDKSKIHLLIYDDKKN